MTSDEYTPDAGEETNPLFGIFAKFGLQINTLTEQIKRSNDREQRRLESLPVHVTFSNTTPAVGATAWMDFGTPQPGRVWDVVLFGVSGVTGATGVPTLYVGANMQTAPGVGIPSLARWTFPSVPNFDNYSPGQIRVKSNEHLLLGFTGLTAPNQVTAVITIADMPQWAQRFAVAND